MQIRFPIAAFLALLLLIGAPRLTAQIKKPVILAQADAKKRKPAPVKAVPKPGLDAKTPRHKKAAKKKKTAPKAKKPGKPRRGKTKKGKTETDEGSKSVPTLPSKTSPGGKSTTPRVKKLEQRIEALAVTLKGLMTSWRQLREQKILIVPSLGRTETEGDLQKSLAGRYKQLLSKRRSNRQWHGYWKDEHKLTRQIGDLYQQYEALGPKYVAQLEREIGRLGVAFKKTSKGLVAKNQLRTTALEALGTQLAELKKKRLQATESTEKLQTQKTKTDKELRNAKAQLKAAKEGGDLEKQKLAQTAIDTAEAALKKLETQLADATKALKTVSDRLRVARQISAVINGTLPEDAELKSPLADYFGQLKAQERAWETMLAGVRSIVVAGPEFQSLKEGLQSADPKRIQATRKRLKKLQLSFDKPGKMLFKADREAEKALDAIRKLISANRIKLSKLKKAQASDRTTLKDEQTQLAALNATLKSARAAKNKKLIRKTLARQRKTSKEVKRLISKIAGAESELQKIAQMLDVRKFWLQALTTRKRNSGDASYDIALAGLRKAEKVVDQNKQSQVAVGARALELYRLMIENIAAVQRCRGRKDVLQQWSQMAKDKTVNQDKYLDAINISIRAVDDRLKQLMDETAPKTGKKATSKVDLARKSPFRKHQDKLAGLRQQKLQQQFRRKRAALNQSLVVGQIKSSRALKQAQTIDLKLLKRETKISTTETSRIRLAGFETKRWQQIWADYAKKAASKEKKLADDLRTTVGQLKGLQVDQQYFLYQQSLHQKESARLEREITNAEAKRWSVLYHTVIDWLKVNAWDLPLGFLLAWLLWQLVKKSSAAMVERSRNREDSNRATVQQVETLSNIATGVIKLAIIVVTAFWLLKRLGVNVVPLLGGAAIFGLAISFGSQNLVRDMVTGFFILLEKQYAVGDVIQVGDTWGTVEMLNLRRTIIRSADGKAHIIPNGSITQVSNMTMGWSVALLHVGVGYESNLSQVREVVDRVGDEMFADPKWKPKFFDDPPRYIGLTEMGDSALVVRVKAKTLPFDQWEVEFELNHRLKEAFDEAGISIPFPQRDVHLYRHDDDAA